MARVSSERHKTDQFDQEDISELHARESLPQQEVTLETLSPEVLGLILGCLSAKTLLNISETCQTLHSECLGNGGLWKDLFKLDFNIMLLVRGQFDSFHDIYRLVYKAQIIFEERNHVTFSGMLPDWMFTWCVLSSTPPNLKFVSLPIGKAKRIWGLLDDELPKGEASGCRRSIVWKEGFEAAVSKWGSEAAFQENVLKRLTRSQKKVESIYFQELQARRKRYYKRLRMGEKYSKMNDVLVRNKNTHVYMSYFEPQLIGEHYINGKLHRFGRKQLKEYMKFAIRLYDHTKATLDEFSESDLVKCVLLTYKDLSYRVQNRFVRWKEFIEYSQKFLDRQQKVWRWQIEKGIEQCIKYRPSEKVQSMSAYNDYIHMGDIRRFRHLKRHFEGLEKISRWFDINNWILDIIDSSVRQTLMDTDNTEGMLPGSSSEARELRKKIRTFLQSGKDCDFRMMLWTVSNIAKSRLKQSASLIRELEGIIKTDRSELLVSVETQRRLKPQFSLRSFGHNCLKSKQGQTSSGQTSSGQSGCRSRSEVPRNLEIGSKRPVSPGEDTSVDTILNTARISCPRNLHFLRKRPRSSTPEALVEQTTALPSYCIKPGTSF